MINEILSTILQVLVFSLIPFLVYVLTKRKWKGFFTYIGLIRSNKKANSLAVLACLLFAAPTLLLVIFNTEIREIMTDPHTITGKFRSMGFGIHSVLLILIIAGIKTALSEEIFFRGFIAKRLIGVLGFQKGNISQAVIFGGIHTALFSATTSHVAFLLLVFVIPAIGAYVSVYLNEKIAHGSIIPGWISHGLANVMAYSIVGFII
jgi:membrane protease YdiL (CAAX protease family)